MLSMTEGKGRWTHLNDNISFAWYMYVRACVCVYARECVNHA